MVNLLPDRGGNKEVIFFGIQVLKKYKQKKPREFLSGFLFSYSEVDLTAIAKQS